MKTVKETLGVCLKFLGGVVIFFNVQNLPEMKYYINLIQSITYHTEVVVLSLHDSIMQTQLRISKVYCWKFKPWKVLWKVCLGKLWKEGRCFVGNFKQCFKTIEKVIILEFSIMQQLALFSKICRLKYSKEQIPPRIPTLPTPTAAIMTM